MEDFEQSQFIGEMIGGLAGGLAANEAGVACFVAGTPVQTADGPKPIEEVKVGDRVLSRSDHTGEIAYKAVIGLKITPDRPTLDIRFETSHGKESSLGVTEEHPFWVKTKGWTWAGELLPGDEIFTSKGGWLRVTGSTWVAGTQTVYNFEVEDFHTYFVGEAEVWVHNAYRAIHNTSAEAAEGMMAVTARIR